MRGCRAGATAGLALAWALAPARAAELHSQGSAPCPDREELGFRVERAIGMPLGRAAALRFDVAFERTAAGYAARLRVAGGDNAAAQKERRLTARDCGQLADAVSVAIALALGAGDTLPPEASVASAEPAPAAAPQEAAAPPPQEAPPPAALREEFRMVRVEPGTGLVPSLALALVVDSGSLPSSGLGAGLRVELRGQRFALRASGTLLFEQHTRLPVAGGVQPGADLSLAFGGLSVCASPLGRSSSSVSLLMCGGWELGRVDASGAGVRGARQGSQLWSAPSADAGVFWALPGSLLRFGALLTLAAPLKRDDFLLGDYGRVYRAPSAVGRLALGVDVSFD